MEYENEPTLRDLMDLVRRGLASAVVAAIALGVAAYLLTGLQTPIYEAQATVLTSSQDPNQRDFGTTLVTAPTLDIESYVTAATSRPVLADAYERATGRAPDRTQLRDLQKATVVRAEQANASSTMRLLVSDENPRVARDLANALADALVAWDVQRATRSLETIIDSLEAQIEAIDAELGVAAASDAPANGATTSGLERARADLTLQLSSARALRSAAVGRIEPMEPAIAPTIPVSPSPLRSSVLAAALAVFLVYGLLLLREALDTRIRSVDALARATGLPVLAEFPMVKSGRRSLPREAASYLRTSVDFATTDAHPKVVLVTSTHSAHGKSSIAMALAESYARQVDRVLLLDADLRKPVLAQEYGLVRGSSSTMRQSLDDPDEATVTHIHIARDTGFDLIASFEAAPDPAELLGHGFRRLLDRMAPDYDVIIVDSAPILPVADALTIAPYCTGVLFAVSLKDTDRKAVGGAIQLLRRLNVRLLGTVATNLTAEGRSRSMGYGYGYGYGPSDQVAMTHAPKPRPRPRSS